jgi:NC domain.
MNRRTASGYDTLLRPGEEPPLAAHLVTPRTVYSHHGIYVGGGRVIHYAGLANGFWRGPVEEISLERFARGRGIRIRPGASRFDSRKAVERARSRLGERRYRLLTNNCEHFCAWVLRGVSCSTQVERLRALFRRLTGTLAWSRRAYAAAGQS